MKNKFALITLEYPPQAGGVSRMYAQIVASDVADIDVYVQRPLTPDRNTDVTYVQLLRELQWPLWSPAISFISQLWQSRKYTSLIIGQVLPLGIPALLLKYVLGVKYDVIVHGMDVTVPMRHWRKKFILKLVLRGAHRIIAANGFVADQVGRLVGSDKKIVIVYPVAGIGNVDTSDVVRQLAISYGLDHGPVMLTVARLVERKGIQYVLDALEDVWVKYPQLNYVIIGNGSYENELQNHIKRLSRPRQIHLLTHQSDRDIASWYALSDIFIMTPITLNNGDCEGLGIVYLEASLYGKPSIATRHGGVPEAVEHGVTGLLVEEKNSNDIAKAIINLLNDEPLRLQMGRQARERASRLFSVDNLQKQLSRALYD